MAKSDSPKVSVIMGIYNCSRTLNEAVESIINQTFQNWELILCDDGSTDDTCAVARNLCGRDVRIKLIWNDKNYGLSYTLNHCLAEATGEYIARMDADDLSLPDRLEKQVQFLNEHPEFAVVGTAMTRFDENGDFGVIVRPPDVNRYSLINGVPFCHATIMMRANAYRHLGGYTVSKRTQRGQDVDLWFRFYAAGFEGSNLNEALYKVREDRAALRRRKLKYSFYSTETRLLGFSQLKFPIYYYPFAFKPIVSYFTPRKMKFIYQNKQKDNLF